MQINITPDDIDKMVKDAIMKSALGKAIENAIQSILSEGRSWDNPFRRAIEENVKLTASQMLAQEPFKSEIERLVAERIKSLVDGGALTEAVAALTSKMIRNAD